jgi:hypothetical protein
MDMLDRERLGRLIYFVLEDVEEQVVLYEV